MIEEFSFKKISRQINMQKSLWQTFPIVTEHEEGRELILIF